MVEGIKAKNLTAVLTFVDLKKAFDSVNRDRLFDILKAYGIQDQIVSVIASMNHNTGELKFSHLMEKQISLLSMLEYCRVVR